MGDERTVRQKVCLISFRLLNLIGLINGDELDEDARVTSTYFRAHGSFELAAVLKELLLHGLLIVILEGRDMPRSLVNILSLPQDIRKSSLLVFCLTSYPKSPPHSIEDHVC